MGLLDIRYQHLPEVELLIYLEDKQFLSSKSTGSSLALRWIQ